MPTYNNPTDQRIVEGGVVLQPGEKGRKTDRYLTNAGLVLISDQPFFKLAEAVHEVRHAASVLAVAVSSVAGFELGEKVTSDSGGSGVLYFVRPGELVLLRASGTIEDDDTLTGDNSGASCTVSGTTSETMDGGDVWEEVEVDPNSPIIRLCASASVEVYPNSRNNPGPYRILPGSQPVVEILNNHAVGKLCLKFLTPGVLTVLEMTKEQAELIR